MVPVPGYRGVYTGKVKFFQEQKNSRDTQEQTKREKQ